ncbi:conserved hypothetical protein [metagenome]|uniref:Uncharacterized protein n=1 Tax=metagenome TaxID=256318 RepID=A0A2P2C2M8_9ZZZZ
MAAPLRPVGVHLRRTEENSDEIDTLATLTGGRAGIDAVLDDLDRRGRRRWVPGLAVSHGFTWEREDRATHDWWPQGITTSADASDTEDIAGRKVLAVSWYAKHGQGSRISFVDLHELRYRHVLLVQPVVRDGVVDLEALPVHAGGIVWCGPYLHVAGTAKGLFTCRLDDLLRIPDHLFDPDEARIGRQDDGRLAAHGYRYVLPVRFTYQARADQGTTKLRYSFLSLDRTGAEPRVIAGEYGRAQQSRRLASFALDRETSHLVVGEDGLARPEELGDGEPGMQGAALVDGTWYATQSHGAWGPGSLWVGQPGRLRERRWALPMGPEDIAYWPSLDTFWSVSEHPHRRWVYAVRRGRVG